MRSHSVILEGEKLRPLTVQSGDVVLAHLESGATIPSFTSDSLALSSVVLLAVVRHPSRIFGNGLNWLMWCSSTL